MNQKLIPTYDAIVLTSRYEVSIKEKVISQLKALLLDEPLFFKRGNNDIFRQCVSEEEMESIMIHFHGSAYGGYTNTSKNSMKILKDGL